MVRSGICAMDKLFDNFIEKLIMGLGLTVLIAIVLALFVLMFYANPKVASLLVFGAPVLFIVCMLLGHFVQDSL